MAELVSRRWKDLVMARKTESPLWKLIESERRAVAADLAGVDEAALTAASELDDWTAKHVLAHIVMPFAVPTPRFLLAMLRRRGHLDAVNRFFAKRPASEPITYLSDNASSQWSPPGNGPELPLTEIAVHAQDLRAALGMSRTVPDDVRSVVLQHVGGDENTGTERRAEHAHRFDAAAAVTS